MKSQNRLFDLPLESKTGTGNWLLLISGGAFFCFLGFKVCAEAFEIRPFNLLLFLPGIICMLLALFCLVSPWLYYRVIIHEDYIELIQFGGLRKQIVWRRELVSYELLEKKAKHRTWQVLKLRTPHDDYSINSQMYANFFFLQHELTDGLRRTYHEENRAKARAERNERIFVYLFGGIIAAGTVILGIRAFPYHVDESQLVPYSCTLGGKPAIQTTRYRGGHEKPSLFLPIREHPDLNFNIYRPTFYAVYAADLVRHLDQGDTIFIRISLAEYETEITKQRAAGFWEKYFGGAYKHIEIYELRSADGTEYLPLAEYERANFRDRKSTFWMIIVMIGLITGLYLWKGKED